MRQKDPMIIVQEHTAHVLPASEVQTSKRTICGLLGWPNRQMSLQQPCWISTATDPGFPLLGDFSSRDRSGLNLLRSNIRETDLQRTGFPRLLSVCSAVWQPTNSLLQPALVRVLSWNFHQRFGWLVDIWKNKRRSFHSPGRSRWVGELCEDGGPSSMDWGGDAVRHLEALLELHSHLCGMCLNPNPLQLWSKSTPLGLRSWPGRESIAVHRRKIVSSACTVLPRWQQQAAVIWDDLTAQKSRIADHYEFSTFSPLCK